MNDRGKVSWVSGLGNEEGGGDRLTTPGAGFDEH